MLCGRPLNPNQLQLNSVIFRGQWQSAHDGSSPPCERVLWQLMCPQQSQCHQSGSGLVPVQLLAHHGLLRPFSSKTLLMSPWGCCSQLLEAALDMDRAQTHGLLQRLQHGLTHKGQGHNGPDPAVH